MITLQLRRGKAESIKRFHPWIFSGAIQGTQPRNQHIEEGEIVRIVDHEGVFIALGHYQIGSIAVRILSFDEIAIDTNFWVSRLRQAFRMRANLGYTNRKDEHSIYRLVHGEGDQLPGLIVDVFGETAVMQAHSVGMHVCREYIADALLVATDGQIKNVYYKSETTLPYKAGLGQENGFLRGNTTENIALENGLKFHIDWLHGQKTGFFVYAMRGAANLVHSVDVSAKAIELTRQNIGLNFPNDARHDAFAEDAFKYLQRAGSDYDLIVLDPPAFAKHKDALRNALKGYTRLNAAAFSKIRPGGIVFTFSCSQAVNKDQFRLAVFTAAAQSKRHVRILHQLHQPADHPINIYHPEGEYLKGLVLYVE